ncbi:MAG: APC family permease [Gammaproteobacteria bacterium]|nr:APC family permease [Gammaproteobacteria bacterium]
MKIDSEKLPRNLGMWGIWLLVVNGLIGAGIFGLPSGAARLAGEWSPLIYVFCALLILPILLSFAELASYFRGTGGPIRYATEAFGHFVGFQAGWLFWVARAVSFAANSVLLVDSIGYFWPAAAEGGGRLVSLFLICGGLTFINVIGSVRAIRSLASLTILKFAVLVLLVIAGLIQLGAATIPSFGSEPGAGTDLGAATLLLIYAFVGFESAVVPAGEARNPSRDMPRALLLGLGMVTALYLLIQLVSVAAVPDIAASDSPLLDVAAVLFGGVGAAVLMFGVVASVGGNLVGAMFSTPRITYALSLDESLPRWFAQVNSRFATPANSIVFYGVLSFLLAAFGSFTWLAAATVLSRLIMYGLSCAAIPVLRPRYAGEDRFVLPFGYFVPLLGIGACLWLLTQVSLDSFLLTGAFIVVGTGFYLLARWQRRGGQQ